MDSVAAMPEDSFPIFVTWNKLGRDGNPHLRGCIGNFSGGPLREMIPEYALTSALRDYRFSPVRPDEVSSLQVAVSLLVDYEDGKDVWDWEIGTHGIIIDFHGKRGTYLPDVMTDQGWTKEQTLESLYRKAGHHGSVDAKLLAETKLRRYKTSKTKATFAEWQKSRSPDLSELKRIGIK